MPGLARTQAQLSSSVRQLLTARISSVSGHLAAAAAPTSVRMSTSSNTNPPPISFEKTPVPANPLGPSTYVRTASCLIIGDEVLNGKTRDSNSNYFAKWCFNLGIELKRIEVIADDTEEIVEAARRMAERYDLVITSGGVGPTHDDLTYLSIAKAFDAEPLEYHEETIRRMTELSKRRTDLGPQTEEMMTARKRMALFPSKNVEVLHTTTNLWVPVVRMVGKVCLLPGVPRLFEALLDGLVPYVPIDKSRPRPHRVLIKTSRPESSIAPFLTKLAERVKKEGISVGSYPKLFEGVQVSLIGTDVEALTKYGDEVARELDGEVLASGKVGDESSE